MKPEEFFLAMNDVQDSYVMEAVTYRAKVRRRNHPVLRGLAAACLALIVGFSAVIAISSQAWATVFGWVHQQVEGFILYYHADPPHAGEPDISGDAADKAYELSLIPEGYTLYDHSVRGKFGSYAYVNYATDQMMYFVYILPDSGTNCYFGFDNHTHHWTTVRGVAAELYLPEDPAADSSTILWIEDEMMMYIQGFFTESELKQLAESVMEVPNSPDISDD